MEAKVIFYVLAGIGYVIYSVYKAATKKGEDAPAPNAPKQVQPKAANPFEEISRELKRKQAEADAKRWQMEQQAKAKKQAPKVKTSTKPADLLVHEKKSTLFQEGVSNYESTYERPLLEEDKIERGKLKVENEGVYRIESIEEEEARKAASQTGTDYTFDARNAIISSIILERKF